MDIRTIHEYTRIDPWFLNNLKQIIEFEEQLKAQSSKFKVQSSDKSRTLQEQAALLRQAKEYGFSDRRLAQLLGLSEMDIRGLEKKT